MQHSSNNYFKFKMLDIYKLRGNQFKLTNTKILYL